MKVDVWHAPGSEKCFVPKMEMWWHANFYKRRYYMLLMLVDDDYFDDTISMLDWWEGN